MEQVTVKILERDYRLSCAPEEKEALLNAAAYVNEKMTAIRDQGKITSSDRIAVFTALNLANELLTSTGGKKSPDKLAFLEFQHKIENLKAVIEGVITPQEKLL